MKIDTILLELNQIEETLIERIETHFPESESSRQQFLHDLDILFMKKAREIMLDINHSEKITGEDVLRYSNELKVLRLELVTHNFMHKTC